MVYDYHTNAHNLDYQTFAWPLCQMPVHHYPHPITQWFLFSLVSSIWMISIQCEQIHPLIFQLHMPMLYISIIVSIQCVHNNDLIIKPVPSVPKSIAIWMLNLCFATIGVSVTKSGPDIVGGVDMVLAICVG